MQVAIIDYGSGNLRSVAKAFERVGASIDVIQTPKALSQASHIVLPGVGAFADCMRGLRAIDGMIAALEEEVRGKRKPFLGICVGMQMLFDEGHEHGVCAGLGWLRGEVVSLVMGSGSWVMGEESKNYPRTTTHDSRLKIPHMGWNELEIQKAHPLMAGIESGAHAYFVHSYFADRVDTDDVIATTPYGQKVTAVVAKGNIMGTQFHPEKSQETGLRLLKNFLAI